MATFSENIQKIESTAVLGRDVRKAIADALMQSVHISYRDLISSFPDAQNVYVRLIPDGPGSDDHIMELSKT
mgnify:CR=1 FL=1